MTSASLTQAGAGPSRGWIRRVAEFLVVGGITPVLFALSGVMRAAMDLDEAEYAWGFTFHYAAHLINDPHFAVTYLLFYEDARGRAFGGSFGGFQRVRYWLAGLVAPLGLAIWGIAAITSESSFALGRMIQLMFLLVGWHYVKQGFGVMTVLSARRGVRYSPLERRVILLHCYAGWAYAWASPFDPGRDVAEKGVFYSTIAHPPFLEEITLAVFGVSAVALAVVLVRRWRRDGALPIVTPLTGLLCSIWAWSIWSGVDPLVRYAVPALHSIQYLYFVALLRGNRAKEREGEPHFEPSAKTRLAVLALAAVALGFLLFDLIPMALDDALVPAGGRTNPDLGPTPWLAALYVFVNVHHYAMDGVIWRRENPETRFLAR
ncbi:MAG: hypothetical protein KC619_07765 [Myxococcales bacterium]|nr:hypothetical protein [Myxococcales bacterium]